MSDMGNTPSMGSSLCCSTRSNISNCREASLRVQKNTESADFDFLQSTKIHRSLSSRRSTRISRGGDVEKNAIQPSRRNIIRNTTPRKKWTEK